MPGISTPSQAPGLSSGGGSSSITSLLGITSSGQKNMAGSLSVTIASDQSAVTVNQGTSPWVVSNGGTFAVQATLSAETTKVIGVTRTADGAGNLLTSNSTTPAAHFALDTNITSILGTAPTTVGFLDIKGADGNVFVRSATAGNFLATVNIASAQTLATVTTVGAVTSLTNALPAGTNNIGAVTPTPTSNSGWSFNYQSALNATKAQIKGSAGTFGGYINLYNPNTAVTYIQVFNKASASVTVGTTAPDFVITLPGIASASGTGSDRNLEITCGVAMGTGITIAATTTATGNTNPANSITATFLFL